MENIQINIPKPCRENWQNMTAQPGGRFCENCQKKVVDFSALSDRELVRRFQNQTAPVCGRLSEYQLNRVLLPQPPKPRFGWLTAFLPLSLWGATAAAQNVHAPAFSQMEEPAPVPVELAKSKNTPKTMEGLSWTLSGFVKSAVDNLPLVGVSVVLKNTTRGVNTDTNGFFQIKLPAKDAVLDFGYIGYKSQSFTCHFGGQPKIEIRLEERSDFLTGEVCVTSYRRNFFQRVVHKLKRGF